MADILVYALAKFVAIPSVSNSLAHKEDCRQAAIWLRKCFTQLGAEASLVSPAFAYPLSGELTVTGTVCVCAYVYAPRLAVA